MPFHRPLLALATASAVLALCFSTAGAEEANCPGKNLLDEMKARDAAAFTRVRAAADAMPNGRNTLWKIEHDDFPDRPASYLYGTLHVTDTRTHHLTAATEEALSVSRRIAFEVEDMSAERTTEALSVMTSALAPGAAAKFEQQLGKPDVERIAVALKGSQLPKEILPRIKPWVALVVASTSACEYQRLKVGKLTQDGEIARVAENRGVGSFGLESAEMLLGAYADLSDADQMAFLKARLAAFDHLDDRTETFVQLYLARDIGALWPLQLELDKSAGASALEAYRQSMLDDRNIRMRDRMIMHLNYGGVFMAVGAMHLAGEKGLVALLKDAGHKLTPVE